MMKTILINHKGRTEGVIRGQISLGEVRFFCLFTFDIRINVQFNLLIATSRVKFQRCKRSSQFWHFDSIYSSCSVTASATTSTTTTVAGQVTDTTTTTTTTAAAAAAGGSNSSSSLTAQQLIDLMKSQLALTYTGNMNCTPPTTGFVSLDNPEFRFKQSRLTLQGQSNIQKNSKNF